MTVAELIKFLQTQPQQLQVAIRMMSDYSLLKTEEIGVVNFCPPRPDGWVESVRPDKPSQPYLLFPGN